MCYHVKKFSDTEENNLGCKSIADPSAHPRGIYCRYVELSPYYRFLADGTDLIFMIYSRIRIHLSGQEKLPGDGKYLLVSNHRSGYDPLCTMHALRKEKLVFISKPENFTIPFIGRLARVNCFRPIDRENARNALVTIKDCADLLKNGIAPVVVYPEPVNCSLFTTVCLKSPRKQMCLSS